MHTATLPALIPTSAPPHTAAAVRALKRRALALYSPVVLPEIKRMIEADMSFAKIARVLNQAGHKNGRGKPYSASFVHYLAKSAGIITT